MELTKGRGLSSNVLKLIAIISMTCDHAAKMFAPDCIPLLIIGRLAFPIFAYMIAEGCAHTRSRGRYFARMAIFAAVCQIAYSVFTGSLYMCILVTFTMSIGLIILLDNAAQSKKPADIAIAAAGFALCIFICTARLHIFKGTDFDIDYRLLGVLLPVAVYLSPKKWQKLGFMAIITLAMDFYMQKYALLALIPLALYSGRRGKAKLKYLFYIYYPLHLLAIELIYELSRS